MVVVNLVCSHGHAFEGWFRSSGEAKDQVLHKLVSCPLCGDPDITQKPSAPHVARKSTTAREAAPAREAAAAVPGPAQPERELWQALRKMLSGAENVGERFADEARRIHYDEAPRRRIRGKASRDQALELLEEGIPVLPLPVVPDEDLNS
ncbi:MAG: DUF1178 family protein [Rhodocyclaceae bacterium]|nr:DUF1178 family protein [Rhodocyclaceae bacterium]